MVAVELCLQLLLCVLVRQVLDHHAKVSSRYSVAVHQPLALDFGLVDQKQRNHPQADHPHEQPSLHFQCKL